MGCSAQDQITGYKAVNKKLTDLNPKVDPVKRQFAINEYWLNLENNIMTPNEKLVYKTLVEQTDGIASISFSDKRQLNTPLVFVKEIGNEYVVYLDNGQNYTFEKGKVKSKPTKSGRTVVLPSMELTKYVDNTGSDVKPLAAGGELYTQKDFKVSGETIVALDTANMEFLKDNPNVKVVEGSEFNYLDNVITLDKDANFEDRVVYLAHEIVHAKTKEWLEDNRHTSMVKMLSSNIDTVLTKLENIPGPKLTEGERMLQSRLLHDNGNKDLRLLENVAVLAAEPAMRKELLQLIPKQDRSIINRILDKIKAWLGKGTTVDATMILGLVDKIVDKSTTNIKGSDEVGTEFGTESDELFQEVKAMDLGTALGGLFWNLEAEDRETVLQTGEESASVPIKSPEFAEFTEGLIESYKATMNKLGNGEVDIALYKNEKLNTSGKVDLETKKISLRYNRMSRTARLSEIFLHEVNHLISADVFANNPRLRRLMKDLKEATLASGVNYTAFLSNAEGATSEEIEIAKRKFDYVFDETADPEEFYAYATTNEAVYMAVKDVQVKAELVKPLGVVETRMQKILQKLIKMINDVWSAATGRSAKGSQQILQMIELVNDLAEEKAEQSKKDMEPGISNRVKNIFNKIDEKVNPIMDKLEAKSKRLKKQMPGGKLLGKISELRGLRDIVASGAVQYLVREVTKDTTNPEFAELYQVTRKTKQTVERATNQIKVGVEEAINTMFTDETESTKKAITHVMFDLDLGHLLDTMTIEGVVEMIKDPAKRAAEIAAVERVLGDKKYDVQIDGLAEYIVTGNTVIMNQQINANNIVEFVNRYPGKKTTEYKKGIEQKKLVDKLVSLKALDKVSDENRALAAAYIDKSGNTDNVVESLTMYKNYMDQMKKDAKTSSYDPIKKGYTQAPASMVKYALVPEEQVKAQLSINMKLESVTPYTVIAGKIYYLMTGKVKSVGFNEGAFGMISNTMDGVSLSGLLRERFEEVGFHADMIDEKVKESVELIYTGKAKGKQFQLGRIKAMIPVHDKAGKIIDYRIQLNKIDKIEMLGEEEDVAKVLAHTYARADKLVRTAEQNRHVVDAVIRQSAVGMSENPEDYVMLEEYTEKDKELGKPYTKLHERWDRIPDYTKAYIFKQLGYNSLPIHKDFVELITGEKQMTLGNFNYMGLDMKQHPIARARIMAIESWVRELLAYVKQTTVILNGSVVMGNTISNMITAAIHGIDPVTYIAEVRKKWLLLNEYNEIERKLARLEVDKVAGRKVDAKIAQLNSQKMRHPYHKLVEDGQFSPIVEDVNVDADTKGQLATLLKEAIDKTGLGGALHPLLDILYLDKKTKIYKTMLKVTQYGDAITRQIILEKNVEKREKRLGRKLDTVEYQEELDYVDQLLINYGYVANRTWDWMEKVAGLNFMKYYLRNIKATYKMFDRNKSATAFSEGIQKLTGVDFSSSMDAYAKSPIMAMTNRFMLDDVPEELSTPHLFGLLPDFSSIVKFH